MRQITQGDAIGAFLLFRTTVTNYLAVLQHPQDRRSKSPFSKAIPRWWGTSFPPVYQVPAHEVAANVLSKRLTMVNQDFNGKLKSVLADSDEDEEAPDDRVVGQKSKGGTDKLSQASKRSSPTIQSNDMDGTDHRNDPSEDGELT